MTILTNPPIDGKEEVLKNINKNVFDKEDLKPVTLPVHQPVSMEPFLPLPDLTPATTATRSTPISPQRRPTSTACAPPSPHTPPGLPPCYSLNSGQPISTLSTYFVEDPVTSDSNYDEIKAALGALLKETDAMTERLSKILDDVCKNVVTAKSVDKQWI